MADEGKLLFGTVETWLIWNLTGGKVHVTDYSNASRTMLFDVDNLCWDEVLCKKFDIPMSILPRPVPSSQVYGTVAPGILGLEQIEGVPISGAIGDQPAALFGQACFKPGQAKNTYGTGCFLLMNTGDRRIRSQYNLLSGVAWGLDGKVEYSLEGSAFNAGSVIKWLRDELHMIDTARVAMSWRKACRMQTACISCPPLRALAHRIGICMPAAASWASRAASTGRILPVPCWRASPTR